MNSWLKIDVPFAHTIMVSFTHLHLPSYSLGSNRGKIEVFTGNLSAPNRRQYIDTKFRPDPELYDTDTFFIHFSKHDDSAATRQFKMIFSIHNNSARPEKLPGGKWNCSVSFWSDFHQHFPCNLHSDCADGRDEEDCPYTRASCGPGRLSIGSRYDSYRLL